jgi:hypothetical protein
MPKWNITLPFFPLINQVICYVTLVLSDDGMLRNILPLPLPRRAGKAMPEAGKRASKADKK